MSHEIRTPLNSIVGFSSVLTMTDDMEEKKEYNQLIQHNNALLLKVVDDVLELSKLEAGDFKLYPAWFCLSGPHCGKCRRVQDEGWRQAGCPGG